MVRAKTLRAEKAGLPAGPTVIGTIFQTALGAHGEAVGLQFEVLQSFVTSEFSKDQILKSWIGEGKKRIAL